MADPQPAGGVPTFELRHRLDRALEHAGLTRDEMARELGVHRNTIGNYLSGKHVPRAVLIAWHLRTGVPLAWLEHGDNGPDGGGDSGGTDVVTLGEQCSVMILHPANRLVAA